MRCMRIAGVQMDIRIGDVDANLARLKARLRETCLAGSRLTIFPECAVAGYCFDSPEEARAFAQTVPGPATEFMAGACAELGGNAIFGTLETDGERLFNTAVMVGPQGVVGSYRKVHLPFLGIDRFTTFGDRGFGVEAMEGVNVGLNICYDSAFPEAARSLAIRGADLIALPTNWPPGAEILAEHVIPARALENGVYYAAVNRVGTERGFTFIGRSSICDPTGRVLARAGNAEEAILYADVDPARARRKHIIRVPQKHEIDRLADRRPEMYGTLLEPHDLPRPGRNS
jgi:predicted amidohydrolase